MSQKFTLVLSRQREQYWVWQRRQEGGRQRQAGRPRQEPGGGFDDDDVWWSSYHDHWNCHLGVSVGIWPVSNQLVGHRVEQLWVHRLKKSLKFKWFDVVWSHSAELEHSLRVAQVAVVNYLLRNTGELFVIFIDCVHQGKWVLQYAVETWIRAFRFFIFFASSITENTAPTLIAIALKDLLENVICLIYTYLLNVSI